MWRSRKILDPSKNEVNFFYKASIFGYFLEQKDWYAQKPNQIDTHQHTSIIK